jgi:DNA invertase Pin-like site-specific DNA recombinase
MTNVVVYTRVSIDGQEYERQINDLLNYAKKQDHIVVKIFSEKISGAKLNAERKELTTMVDYCLTNNVDIICVTELSR